MAPVPATRMRAPASVTEKDAVAAAASAAWYATSAVASLKRLSDSSRVTTRRGAPMSRNRAVAATASVAESIAPSANATGQPISGTNACAMAPTSTVDTRTRPIASERIGRSWARMSRGEISNPAMYTSGGRNSRKISSGASATCGMPGVNASSSPPTTSKIG